MCDYGDYEAISEKIVKIRISRRCGSCDRKFQPQTLMTRYVGKTEGDFGVNYGCKTCVYVAAQEECSRFHLCWNWGHDNNLANGGVPESVVWEYVNKCLNENTTPNEPEFEKVIDDYLAKEELS